MKKPRKKSKDIYLIDLAEMLPVGKVFNKYEFSAMTGILEFSCNPRLLRLCKDGFLTKHKNSRPVLYKMTEHNKANMLLAHEENRARKGKRGLPPKDRSMTAEDYEVQRKAPFNKLLLSTAWI